VPSDWTGEFEKRRRRLPHWEGPGETYFLTMTLKRPPAVDLTDPRVAETVIGALRYFDGQRYLLFDYTVMPDHLQLIIRPLSKDGRSRRLSSIVHSLKSWLAHEINRLLARDGQVWQDETYDHLIRDEKDYRVKAAYIFDNPRRSGLANDPAEWLWWGVGSGVTSETA
jgi:putative transposase